MKISIEISYYPLSSDYAHIVGEFIAKLESYKEIQVVSGGMSSLIVGEFADVFYVLETEIYGFMEKYSSVFNLKIANSCPIR